MDEQIIDFVRSCAQCQQDEQIIDFVRSCAQCQKDEQIIDFVRSCAQCQKGEQIIDFVRSCAQCQKDEQIIDFVRSCAQCQKDERIIDYVRSCAECQKDKAARHQPYGLLNPLELAYSPWQSIAIDFIADLPLCEGCDQLWAVINQFTKMAHFLPLQKDGKTASDLAKFSAREGNQGHEDDALTDGLG